MTESKFKTLRHIEAVRNYINFCVNRLIQCGEKHDKTKLEPPELDYFVKYTPLLKGLTYGSDEYKRILNEMRPAIEHHNKHNRHHPEHHENGIDGMHLIDLLEMVCDWMAASKRHNNGDIFKSLEINKDRFNISPQLYSIMKNTFFLLSVNNVEHKAEES